MVFFFYFYSNSLRNFCEQTVETPDQTSHSVASDLGLHCLPMSNKKDPRLIYLL